MFGLARLSGTRTRTAWLRSPSMPAAQQTLCNWRSAARLPSFDDHRARRIRRFSRWWDHHFGARWNLELTPPLQPMSKRHGQRERNECAEHDKAKGADNMTEDRAESMAKKIADGNEARRPKSGSEEIQRQKALPANSTQPHSERRKIAHAIDKPEGQNEAGVVPLKPAQRRFDTISPSWKSVQDPETEMPTDPEINLVTGEAAKPSGQEQQDRVEQALRGRKAGEQHDRLAFEEGPDERDQIGICAVLGDQPINVHSQPLPAPSTSPGKPLEGAARRSFPDRARMLGFSRTPVERDSCTPFDFPSLRGQGCTSRNSKKAKSSIML